MLLMVSQLAIYFPSCITLFIFLFLKPCNAIHRWQNGQRTKYSVSSNIQCKETKRASTLICILLQAFQNFSRLLISELIINLKYTFNIPFRINLKAIIMGTSQFHDGAQLANILPTLSSEILYTSGLGSRNLCQDLELPFKQ